jgi:hypothetical protein
MGSKCDEIKERERDGETWGKIKRERESGREGDREMGG